MPKDYKINGFTFTMPDEDEGAFCGDFFDFYTNYWRVNGERPEARDSDREFFFNTYFTSSQQQDYDKYGGFSQKADPMFEETRRKFEENEKARQECNKKFADRIKKEYGETNIEAYSYIAGYRVKEDPAFDEPFKVIKIYGENIKTTYTVSTFMMKLAQQHPESFAAAMYNIDTLLILYRQKQYKKIFNFLAIYARRQR